MQSPGPQADSEEMTKCLATKSDISHTHDRRPDASNVDDFVARESGKLSAKDSFRQMVLQPLHSEQCLVGLACHAA